jgi:succinate-acetate transporter protein
MAVYAEERGAPTLVEAVPAADPAPLGLAAFALTTFMISGHNATFIPDVAWVGLAMFYGGLVQLLAGMWEFRNRNVFGATAFSTYGGFWLSLGGFVILAEATKVGAALKGPADVANSLAWFLIAFAVFNTYMLMWSTRVSLAVFSVFATLEATLIILAIGNLRVAHGMSPYWVHVAGWVGIATAACAWYASAAGVINGMAGSTVMPVGRPLWGGPAVGSRRESSMPRRREVAGGH